MRRFKYSIYIISVLLLVVICSNISTFAISSIDVNQKTSLNIEYKIEDKAIEGIEFKLYRVADVSSVGNFSLVEDFEKYSVSFDGLTNSGWTDMANMLADYVSRDNLDYLMIGKTDSNGKLVFSNCSVGMYLVIGNKHTLGNYNYVPEPFLISLPTLDKNVDDWVYDVFSEPKSNGTKKPSSGGSSGSSRVSYTAKKVWEDNVSNRPNSIEIELLRDGKVYDTVVLNEENKWQKTWSNLSNNYSWSIVEKEVPDGYIVGIKRSGTTYIITNTLEDVVGIETPTPSPTSTPISTPTPKPVIEDVTPKPDEEVTPQPSEEVTPKPSDDIDGSGTPDIMDGGTDDGLPNSEGDDISVTSPKTGDNNRLVIWAILFGVFAIVAVGGTVVLVKRKRVK